MDLRHVARLGKARRHLAAQLKESDSRSRGEAELAALLRPTLKDAREALEHLYNDKDVWKAARQAVTAVDIPARQLVEWAPNYRESLPPLLELFGYLPPPPAAQLVSNAVTSLQTVPAGENPAAAIDEARHALRLLLDKTLPLEDAEPWQLPIIASEAIPALDMGVTLAAGAASGAVTAAIGTAIIPAALATGGLAVAPMMILGGIYCWRRNRRTRARDEELLKRRKQLSLDLVPAARAAVLQHLNAIVDRSGCTIDENPQDVLDLGNHLQALIDITRRFGASNLRLRTAAKQKILKGKDAFDFDVLEQMPKVFAAALKAKGSLDDGGQINQETRAELKRQREIIKSLGPRFPNKPPPKIKPKP
jgi:hypothetical protein